VADNLDALAALPLFMSLRAAIRAHVLAARIDRNQSGKATILEDARAYFELAERLIDPPAPTLVAVGGLSGTGKSVLARALASHIPPEPGAIILRTDLIRKEMFGLDSGERLPQGPTGRRSPAKSMISSRTAQVESYRRVIRP
jgi:hypothetical protein